MADIFQEIDEDLRRDRMAKLWQRYGKFVIGAAVLMVVGSFSVVKYQEWRRSQDEALGLKFSEATALIANGDQAKGIAALEAIAAGNKSSYGLIARIEAAADKAKGTDKAGGIAALQAIAADGAVDQEYRDLANILGGLYGADDEKPADLIARLKPLTIAPNPWRFTALELTALAQLRAGERAEGLKTYQALADDLGAPQSTRARASEIVSSLTN